MADVLITVKTSPQPSLKYGDTVCVAGIRIDGGRFDWVRIYPIPFRWLGSDQQFKKYDVVRVELRRRDQDSRPESYSPTIDSIERVAHKDKWKDREPIMRHVARTSTCEMRRNASVAHNAPSLGMVDIAEIVRFDFAKHPGWTPAEAKKIAAAMEMPSADLFGSRLVPPKLVAPRFKVSYRYRCSEPPCPTHTGQILDWELSELQRHLKGKSDEELRAAVKTRFVYQMMNPRKMTSFFMGNFEDPRKRHNFSVLGVYYPDRTTAMDVPLFDL
ncbi:hypothetical protein SAMN04489806_0983 [Paramicrobacterium humi]|uniref:Uncharacterized protein n=1 Tax=Paramicrobacterium humi TaxID=640635 RepID=A0A1H4K3P2_9MICO|nr:hypothetical protein [Microbacterium humi]SEB52715.1 hypothetical protein SAMN04489806_0983 [Microbacterium humi]